MKAKPSRDSKTRRSKNNGRPSKRDGLLAAKLVRVGNSRGIRIPKALLEQTGLPDQVTLRARGDCIVIEPARHPRAGWEEAMRRAVAEHGNELTEEDREWLDAPLNTEFDEKEWTW